MFYNVLIVGIELSNGARWKMLTAHKMYTLKSLKVASGIEWKK